MEWVLLAILPAIVWSFASVCDKVLVSRFVKDGISAGILTNIFSGILILLLIPFAPIAALPKGTALLFLFIGAVWGWNRLAYVKSMSLEEATKVVAFSQLSPIIILLGSAFFFSEVLRLHDFLAFAFILGGVVWISLKKSKGEVRISPAMLWMILSSFLFAAATLLLKNHGVIDWWSILFWINAGFALGSLPFLALPKYFSAVKSSFSTHSYRLIGILLLLNIFTLAGRATYFLALQLGPAAIVAVLSSIQIVFIFLLALLFTRYAPTILKEDTSRSAILSKLGAITLILLGIGLLYLG